jgi:hypothetical protein
VGIVVGPIVLAIIVIILFWQNYLSTERKWKASGSFTPPVERDDFIQAKTKANLKDPLSKDEMRKLLIKRALKAIPIIISLQNEGQSIDRLYKKGMLTDDMHFRIKELKAFVDQEYQDVQAEANELFEGWGEHVWQQAMQFHMMIQRQLEAAKVQQQQIPQEKSIDKPADNSVPSNTKSSSAKKVEE